jgi:tetratricopeptide (TPR) repeat protein
MSNPATTGALAVAQVMAHCGGSPEAAVHFLASAIASAPQDPEPYEAVAQLWREQRSDVSEAIEGAGSLEAVLVYSYTSFLENDMDEAAMAIGSVTGARPDIAWADAPWFGDDRFLGTVSPEAMAEAAMRTMDYGHDLDSDATRERLRPWFAAIERVCADRPAAEPMAKMAIMLRGCGLVDESFALCDRADAVERIMLTEVVRAGTWRKLGEPERAAEAFERALAADPANWSLYLDLADARAELGDFAAAVRLAEQGIEHGPDEITLRAARAAYRARLDGSADALRELLELAPELPNPVYRNVLVERACGAPGLPADLVAEARRAVS